jgi:hypothetical protein
LLQQLLQRSLTFALLVLLWRLLLLLWRRLLLLPV